MKTQKNPTPNSKRNIFETNQKLTKKGIIKHFSPRKGYGFIYSKDTTRDVFVHQDDMKGKFQPNDPVVFDLTFSEKGLIAKNVHSA